MVICVQTHQPVALGAYHVEEVALDGVARIHERRIRNAAQLRQGPVDRHSTAEHPHRLAETNRHGAPQPQHELRLRNHANLRMLKQSHSPGK
jgi:hypothetical protein